MKMCVLINSLTLGGAEKIAITLSEEYKKNGIDVVFVCLEKDDFYKMSDGEKVLYLSSQTGTGESAFKKLFYLLVFAMRLKRLVERENISVVQSHLYRANYVNILAKLLGSKHKAQIVNHGIVSRYEGESLTGKASLLLIRKLYTRADQVIVNSRGMMADLRRKGNFRNDMCVINNPFDVSEIARLKEEVLEEHEFVFDGSKTYLITVGRLERVKRIPDIISAIGRLNELDCGAELIILGDGSEKKNILRFIDELGLKDKIHVLGRVSNPFKYISKADILISASEYEGFSNVIVEGLASGTAVISTDCESGPREILAPGSDVIGRLRPGEMEYAAFGVLVPVGDSKTMAKAIGELLYDTVRLRHYSENGLKRARQFDKALIKKEYLRNIASLMEK